MVALIVLGPEQMPVVARSVIKIIRELRAAANDTISEIRQSLEEPPPAAEREPWRPPSHQDADSGSGAPSAANEHPDLAGHEAPAQDESARKGEGPADLGKSVSYRPFEVRQEGAQAPDREDATEQEQVWESVDDPREPRAAQPKTPPNIARPETPDIGAGRALSGKTDAAEERQRSETAAAGESPAVSETGAAAQTQTPRTPDAASERAGPASCAAASSESDGPEPRAGKPL